MASKSGKILAVAAALIAIAGLLAVYYLYNLKPKDLKDVKADHVLTSSELIRQFEENEEDANKKYVNSIVEITGEIGSITKGENNSLNISLTGENSSSSVICTVSDGIDANEFTPGQKITIRGECSGHLLDVLINRCIIVE